jgi:hypothetical protein
MERIPMPVLDDDSRDCMILGWASTPEAAADILKDRIGEEYSAVFVGSLPAMSYNPDVQDAEENKRAEKVGVCWLPA